MKRINPSLLFTFLVSLLVFMAFFASINAVPVYALEEFVIDPFTAVLYHADDNETNTKMIGLNESGEVFNFTFKGAGEPAYILNSKVGSYAIDCDGDDWAENGLLMDDTEGTKTMFHNGTIEFWFRPANEENTTTPLFAFFGKNQAGAPTDDYLNIYKHNAGGYEGKVCWMHKKGTTYIVCSINTKWNAGQWYHVAAIWYTNATNNVMELWINGTMHERITNAATIKAGSAGEMQMCRDSATTYYFNGSLDEIRFSTIPRYSGTNISIVHPWNFTYSNDLVLELIVEVHANFDVDKIWYSLNGGDNQSYNRSIGEGDTIFTQLGDSYLIVYANDTSGYVSSTEVYFNVQIRCDISALDDSTCGGDDYKSVIRCKQLGKETFQWDSNNMTFCEFGCFDGRCLEQNSSLFCKDTCMRNETICLRDYSITCNLTVDDCWDWNDSYQVWCEFGCFDGLCQNGTDFCNPGETKCINEGKDITYCDDDDGDGFYEWSKWNVTHCEYRCEQSYNSTSQLWNASCHYHSYTLPERLFSRMQWISGMLSAPFHVPDMRMGAVLVLAIAVMLVLSIMGSWRFGAIGFFGVLVFGTLIGWFPWYFTFILGVFGGLILWRS